MKNRKFYEIEPQTILKIFYDICQIPHLSGHEEKLRQYCIDFLTENKVDFKYQIDKIGNIVISMPASLGCEQKPCVALQAHLDMVPVKESGVVHDFLLDEIDAYEEKGWINANGTTLGADNGVGIAIILAYAVSKKEKHGPLELIFTVQEEIGMQGMAAFKMPIQSQYFINLAGEDEEENKFAVGCLGSKAYTAKFKPKIEKIKGNLVVLEFTIDGLVGGHAGSTAVQTKANAISGCLQIVQRISNNYKIKFIDIDGGESFNAIPSFCSAIFAVEKEDSIVVQKQIHSDAKAFIKAYSDVEKNISYSLKRVNNKYSQSFNEDSSLKTLKAFSCTYNGLMFYNKEFGLQELSLNLGKFYYDKNKNELEIKYQVRTLNMDRLDWIMKIWKSNIECLNFSIEKSIHYPPWLPKKSEDGLKSTLLTTVNNASLKLLGKPANFYIMNAGLETTFISSRYPKIEGIVLPVNIQGAHSSNEKIEIKSITTCDRLLKEIIKNL